VVKYRRTIDNMASGKDPFNWIIYITLVHAMLYIFFVIGAFSTAPELGEQPATWAISDIAGYLTGDFWSAIITAGLSIVAISVASLITGKITYGIVFGIITGVYVNVWTRLSGIINEIASSVAPYSSIVTVIGVIIGTVFALVIINGVLQTLSPTQYGG